MMKAVCPRCNYEGEVSMDGEWADHPLIDCDARLAAQGAGDAAFTVKCACAYHGADGRCPYHQGQPVPASRATAK